jgi:hypothetical protein
VSSILLTAVNTISYIDLFKTSSSVKSGRRNLIELSNHFPNILISSLRSANKSLIEKYSDDKEIVRLGERSILSTTL